MIPRRVVVWSAILDFGAFVLFVLGIALLIHRMGAR